MKTINSTDLKQGDVFTKYRGDTRWIVKETPKPLDRTVKVQNVEDKSKYPKVRSLPLNKIGQVILLRNINT